MPRPAAEFTFTGFNPSSARIGETITIFGTGFDPDRSLNYAYLDKKGTGVIFGVTADQAEVYEANENLTQLKVRVLVNVYSRAETINRVSARVGSTVDYNNTASLTGITIVADPLILPPKLSTLGRKSRSKGQDFLCIRPII